MKLKLDDAGHVALDDGKPVYVDSEGKDIAVDVPQLFGSVKSRAEQNKRIEDENKAFKDRLKAFEGIEDPAKAIDALKIVSNLDAKKLVDAGELEKVRADAVKAVRDEYEPVVKDRDALQGRLNDALIGGSFANSKFIAENLAIPPDMVRAAFGSRFKIEGDSVVAYDEKGNVLLDPANAFEPAKFDAAIRLIVDAYPHKDTILKGSGASGSGAPGGKGGTTGRTMTRAQFQTLSPAEQSATARDAKVTITD